MFNKKVLSLFALSLLFLSLFAFVVSAQGSGSTEGVFTTLFKTLFGGIGNLFGFESTTEGIKFFDEGGMFSKILLFFLVALVIYSIGNFMPFLGDKSWVTLGIAIIISILATFYLKTDEITTILFSYKALGIILTGIIPFLAIAGISKKSSESGHLFLSKFLWVGFLIVLLVRFTQGVNATGTDQISQFGKTVYSLLAVAALVMLVIEKKLWRLFQKERLKSIAGELTGSTRLDLVNQVNKYNQEIATLLQGGTKANNPQIKSLKDKIEATNKVIAML